ncbi:MAG: amylo-alpha-1,6-glucosidase [Candidatus Nanohaloarchaea archaeon]
MEYTFHENQSDYVGTISNLHGFLHRNLGTGFDTKWCGFWVPPYKFLDYYALKVNGLWLNNDTLECTEYGDKMVFHHETDSLSIKEVVSTPEKLPGMKLEVFLENNTDSIKAARAVLELGVDIRRKDQDIGPEDYETEFRKNRLTVSNGDRKLMVSSDHTFMKTGGEYIKNHHPGENQRCLVPGNLGFNVELGPGETRVVEIEFTSSDTRFSSMEHVYGSLQHEFGHSFRQSRKSMENLCYDRNGPGIIAGHPWFQSYWARDTFWSLMGLIDAGYFEFAHDVLENFAKKDIPGTIDLDEGQEELERDDTAPLFIIASEHLKNYYRLSDRLVDAREKAMESLKMDGNLVDHDPKGTWMDTMERENAVDIQSLWLEAARIMNDERKDRLEKGLEEFVDDERVRDNLDNELNTINTAIPLMFDQLDEEVAERELEKINGEFSSRHGARTVSAMDPAYQSEGYHTGSVWELTTAWAASANFIHGNETHGESFLRKMAHKVDKDQPGAFPEVVNAETGDLLGCPEQAWSAGMFLHAIDRYMLGIKPVDGTLVIKPPEKVEAVRKGKKIGDRVLDIRIDSGDVTVLSDEAEAINTGDGKFRIEFS